MTEKYFNTSFSFTLGGIRFEVDVDISLSAATKNEIYKTPANVLHYHPMHELFFVFDDPIAIDTADNTLEYKNCIVCIPPNVKHTSKRVSDYRILFSFYEKENADAELSRFFSSTFSSRDIFSLENRGDELKPYLEEFCRIFYNRENDLEKELANSLLKLIFYKMYMFSEKVAKKIDAPKESYYLIISQLIASSTTLDSNVTLGTVAKALHLSEKQTARIINKYFSKPLSTLVNEAKLDLARYLLTSTSLSMSEVARSSNFHSENYFYSQFKKAYGITPLAYRKGFTK